jgi:AcrR family transcriptional regulator
MDMQERILQKSTNLFLLYGIRSITMDEIALQLGISKKTIYQFYADKNELVTAVIMRILDHNRNYCEVYKSNAKNAVMEVFMAMEMSQELFKNMNPSMLYDLEKYHPEAFEKFTEFKNNYLFRIIKDNLEWGLKEELYRPDINTTIMTLLRLETLMLPFNPNVFSRTKFNMGDVQLQLIEQFLYGLVSSKGYKMILKYKADRTKTVSHDKKETI